MFSSDSNAWIFNGDSVNEEFRNAFRHPLAAIKLGSGIEYRSDCHMNPPLKRGKYSMIVDDDGEKVGTSEQPKEGWKRCDYVSNRTRLRCQNVRRHENLKGYGFCEEHRGFIDRVRKEGLRAKQCFDSSFSFDDQNVFHLANDVDETLLSKHPNDFPFVYESLYCDNRLDDNDNPLSRAKVFTKREIVKQYISALRRQDASIQQMRIIYQEKHRRTLHQIMELRGKSHLTKLNPTKDSQKIKRILAIRQYLLKRHNWDRILERKLTERTPDVPSFTIPQWMKQLVEDVTQVCARINQPWDGTRHKATKFIEGELEKVENNNHNNNSNNIVNNNTSCKNVPLKMRTNAERVVHVLLPQHEATKKPRLENDNKTINTDNNNTNYGTYQQYLSLQRLIPGPRYSLAKTISRT